MMLLMIAAEFDATGAEAMFWFQGLSDGKSCWPRRDITIRCSSGSTRRNRLCLVRAVGREERENILVQARSVPLRNDSIAKLLKRWGRRP